MSKVRAKPSIAKISGYVPGEQPKAKDKIVKLNTNENPYPPSPAVAEIIQSFDLASLRRYPDPTASEFREAAGSVLKVPAENILATNGSDEVLGLVLRTFVDANEILAYPNPTYSLYPVLAAISDVKTIEVPWLDNWQFPAKALLNTKAKAIFLANPNAPSGTLVSATILESFAKRYSGLLLIDEAYVDFAETSCLSLLETCDNVIISRSLSKSYSLAGVRFGFAVGPLALIQEMHKVRDSYNCDALSIAIAKAAILDKGYAQGVWNKVKAERLSMTKALEKLGFILCTSHANFLFLTCPDGKAKERFAYLKSEGILIRYFDAPGLRDKLRISIGTPEENAKLLETLSAFS